MNVARLALDNSKLVWLVVALVTAGGLVSVLELPSNIYPEVEFPRITVVADAGHLSPKSMLLSVTRPLEEAARAVPGVRRVRSKTIRGSSEVDILLEPGADVRYALQLVQAQISESKEDLPPSTSILAERLTPSLFPILSVNLTGGLPASDLRDLALYEVRPRLSRIDGVSRVEVLGSDVREISVQADPDKLQSFRLGLGDVAEALRGANVIQTVGRLPHEYKQFLVLASGELRTLDDIRNTVVTSNATGVVLVKDVAKVDFGVADPAILIVGNGRPGALINVSRQIGGNILEVAAGVKSALKELRRTLPPATDLTISYDLGSLVRDSIENVRDAILIGGALAILVLIVFLRDWRITAIAATTLPLTMVATFLFMRVFGATINLMSMGGLAIAIGLVIDDAIVVVESIHRHLRANQPTAVAVEGGTNELVAPVVGSTLTTVVVFLPLGLLQGVVGQFFSALSLTLATSVLISLFLAIFFIPALAGGLLKPSAAMVSKPEARGERVGRFLTGLGFRFRWVVGVAAVVWAVLGWYLHNHVATGFLPEMDEGGHVVDYWTPAGTSLRETDRMVRAIETVLSETPEVESFSRRTGSEMGLFATEQNRGDIVVKLKTRRSRSAEQIIEDQRARLAEAVPGATIEFVQILSDVLGDLEGNPEPIEVKFFGDDADQISNLALQLEDRLRSVPGIVDINGPRRGNPELQVSVSPLASARAGLNALAVSQQLERAMLGTVATQVREHDRLVPVRVRLPDQYRFDYDWLRAFPLETAHGGVTPLSSVADLRMDEGQSELLREDFKQMSVVTARLERRDLGSAVEEIRSLMSKIDLPAGCSYEIGGQYESQQRSFRDLVSVLLISAMLVFTVMVAQFKRLRPAMVILAATPLAMVGALGLLWLTGLPLNVSSFMGLILLVGLVVKNGIILVDCAHRLQEEGLDLTSALRQAAGVRFRPILMTTLCTLFGLLPLALGVGSGAELQKPLAIAVIGGLTISTLVTLVFIPVLYRLVSPDRSRDSLVKPVNP